MRPIVLRGIAAPARGDDVVDEVRPSLHERDFVVSRRVSAADRNSAVGAFVIVLSKEGSPLRKGVRALRSFFLRVVLDCVVPILLRVLSGPSETLGVSFVPR